MDDDVTIDGLDEILKGLDTLRDKGAKRVMTAALKGGLKVIGDQMKKDLDPKVKTGKASVKSRIQTRGGESTA